MKKNKQMPLPLLRQNPKSEYKEYIRIRDKFYQMIQDLKESVRLGIKERTKDDLDWTLKEIELYSFITADYLSIVNEIEYASNYILREIKPQKIIDIEKFNQFMFRFFQKNKTLFNTLKSDDNLKRNIKRTLEKIAPLLDNTLPQVTIETLPKKEVILTYDTPNKVIIVVKPNLMQMEVFGKEKIKRKLTPKDSYREMDSLYHKGKINRTDPFHKYIRIQDKYEKSFKNTNHSI